MAIEREEQLQYIQLWEESGLTKAAFCRQMESTRQSQIHCRVFSPCHATFPQLAFVYATESDAP